MYSKFPLFQSHLDFTQSFWGKILCPEDIAIDATCGNGHDTLILSRMAGVVHAIDLQSEAINNCKRFLKDNLTSEQYHSVHFHQTCHSKFPKEIAPQSVKLIVYNLGYLPGSNKATTTLTETTLESLNCSLELVGSGGVISVTCYPGHPEGKVEEERLLLWASTLAPSTWSCSHTRWINRKLAPSVMLLQKVGAELTSNPVPVCVPVPVPG